MVADYKNFRKSGVFSFGSAAEVQGELILDGANTTLNLYSQEPLHIQPCQLIQGTFYDRSMVSLIDCIMINHVAYGYGENSTSHAYKVFPHLSVLGTVHIDDSEKKFSGIQFVVDDAPSIFFDNEAFGFVTNADDRLSEIVCEIRGGWKNDRSPHLFYYSGKEEIFSVSTVLGTISANHRPTIYGPSTTGIKVDNLIYLYVAFDEKKQIHHATRDVLDLLRLIEVLAGRAQNISNLQLLFEGENPFKETLDIYWSMPPRRECETDRAIHPGELLLDAANDPEGFGRVLSSWLSRNEVWRTARARCSNCLVHQNSYNVDRLVAAANMFDILPASIFPAAALVTSDIQEARDKAKILFRSLPSSPERDSVLGALGRIGTATLKRKVRSRAQLIADISKARLPDLFFVVDHAIDCRNYFVHGTEPKCDLDSDNRVASFFTDTLEFVFAASDLIESGWDMEKWAAEPSTLSHPFGRYLFSYSEGLERLRAAVARYEAM